MLFAGCTRDAFRKGVLQYTIQADDSCAMLMISTTHAILVINRQSTLCVYVPVVEYSWAQ